MAGPSTIRRCAKCKGQSLDSCAYEGQEIDVCPRCGGLWCEPRDWVEADLGAQPKPNGTLQRAPGITATGRSALACPACRSLLTVLRVEAVDGLEIDQCDTCAGVWFDKSEWPYLQSLREWQRHRTATEAPGTWGQWIFQFLSALPVEFNIRPRRRPYATLSIITLCVLTLFGLGLTGIETFAFSLDRGGGWGAVTLMTHQLVHANLVHLLSNMYFLYILGDNVEDILGPWRFVLLYFACGAVGAIALEVASGSVHAPLVGASGAVAGIMAAYVVLFRDARLTLMLFVWQIKVRAWVWIGLWLALQVLSLSIDPTSRATHVAWASHLGGFLAGLVFVWPQRSKLVEGHPLLHLLATHRLATEPAKAVKANAGDAHP